MRIRVKAIPDVLSKPEWRKLRARVLLPLLAGVVALIAVVNSPASASAHAEPTTSTPSPDVVLTAAPTSVTISFSQVVNPNGSDIVVYDSTGAKVTTAAATLVNGDLQKMSAPLQIQGQGDDAAEFLVVWHTSSVDDGETAIGAFSFTVDPKGSGATKAPAASSTDGGSASGISPLLLALVGVVGILAGGAGGYALARRRLKQLNK